MTTGTTAIPKPAIVTAAEWELARAELLAAEKRVTRAEDAVAAQRRRLPMVRVQTDYVLSGPGDEVFRTYSTTQRGVDRLVFTNSIADLLPYGRQEDWEDSPEGWPQHATYG